PEPDVEEAKKDSIGKNDDANANAEIEDDNLDTNLEFADKGDNEFDEDIDKSKNVEPEKEYSEANQYFPTNFGLTFCVPKDAKTLTVKFNYAKYVQIKPIDAVIEIKEEDYKWFSEHQFNTISEYFKYENG